jgi:hypothetical protein
MKSRRYQRRDDGVKQHYWVGRKHKTKSLKKKAREFWYCNCYFDKDGNIVQCPECKAHNMKSRRYSRDENSGYFNEYEYESGRRENNRGYEFNPRRRKKDLW